MELLFLGLMAAAGGLMLFDLFDHDDSPEETGDPVGTSSGNLTLSETADGDATIHGTDGDDVFNSNLGEGAALDDYAQDNDLNVHELHAGDGNDTIHTTYYDALGETDPAPTVFGEGGDDSIYSERAHVDGGTGHDTIRIAPQGYSGHFTQIAEGGDGDDSLVADPDMPPHVVGPLFADFELHGDAGDDTLTGFASTGPEGSAFFGGEGNDAIAIDGTFHGTVNADGGAGDDTISVDRMVHYYQTNDDIPGLTQFTEGDFALSGGEGADRFEVNADIRYVQDGQDPAILATVTDFNPAEDVLSISYETGDVNPHVFDDPAGVTQTTNHDASFGGLSEAADGSYTDVIISVNGEDADDGTPITQDFAVRLEGVSGLDPASVTVDGVNGEILIG